MTGFASDYGMRSERDVWPAVVVGAGPAGLVAAITLARAGIQVLVLNKQTTVFSHPRATVVSLRSMELFRSWGLEDEILAGGDDVEWRMLVAPTLAMAGTGELIEVGYPSRSESAQLSPTRPAAVPQDHLEKILLNYLRSLPSAHVEFGITVEDVWEAQIGLGLRLRTGASGMSRVIQARYLIGGDGAHSVVRQSLGIGLASNEDLLHSFSAVIRAPLWEVVGRHRYGIYVTDTPASGTFLPAGQGDRWVYAFSWDPRLEHLIDPGANELIARIRAAAGVSDLHIHVLDQRWFTFSAAIADQFRMGSAFLIGDAAHRVTPRGGTGMNTAIGDGFNLGWKLSWVLNGWVPESILDSYQVERRPVAEHNLARSVDPMGSRRSARDEVPFDLGGRLPHVWIDTAEGRISSLDLLGPGLTLLSADELRVKSDDRVISPPLAAAHRLERRVAAALGADKPTGLLLRPDGVVWDPPAAAVLEAA
jgi:putative polyketide hydroxylase